MTKLSIPFDASVYRLTAVKKAGYRFGDRCFVEIDTSTKGMICVTLTPKAAVQALGTLEGDFRNEALDQDLRETIAEETERVRNLLLAQAFSGVSLTDQVGETADYRDDPLRISGSHMDH